MRKRLAAITDLPPYTEEDFLADMRRVTLGRGDAEMARILVGDSRATVGWLRGKGIRMRLLYERQADAKYGAEVLRQPQGIAAQVFDGGRGLRAPGGRRGRALTSPNRAPPPRHRACPARARRVGSRG